MSSEVAQEMTLASSLGRRHSRLGPATTRRYVRAGYRLLGNHSGIQICRWTRAALMGRRRCYKRWYGIESHRCLQLTPALQFCNLRCIFCWRFHTSDRFKAEAVWDPPNMILDEAISAQRRLLSGFKANPFAREELFKESMNPVHVAISLDGEPTLYPMIGDLVQEIGRRGMPSFLVTNGTVPSRLQDMIERGIEPTNLYLSLYGPDKQTYDSVTRPLVAKAWERIRTSLKLLRVFKRSRTIIRLTLVKGENMNRPECYSRLVVEAAPSIVELKGYSWLGESRQRLPIGAMPYQTEIKEFARRIEEASTYKLIAEDSVSRVVLLARDGSTMGLSLDSE